MKLSILKEFKEFAVKGNMIDIAIGVVIGAAFNKVVDVMVKEIILPPLSFLTDGLNWENSKLVLRDAVVEDGAPKLEKIAIGYGKLVEAGIDFLVIGFTVFIVVKFMNSLRKKADDPVDEAEATPKDIELLHKLTEQMEQQIKLLQAIEEKGTDT